MCALLPSSTSHTVYAGLLDTLIMKYQISTDAITFWLRFRFPFNRVCNYSEDKMVLDMFHFRQSLSVHFSRSDWQRPCAKLLCNAWGNQYKMQQLDGSKFGDVTSNSETTDVQHMGTIAYRIKWKNLARYCDAFEALLVEALLDFVVNSIDAYLIRAW